MMDLKFDIPAHLPARLPDWRARLTDYMGQVVRIPFRPGAHDCALFAAGAVEAQTGRDLAAAWRGKYRALGAGRAMLRAQGYADHLALVAAILPEVAPSHAQVGDLAVLASDIEGEAGALGVIQGPHVYVLTPTGLALVSRLHVKKAFAL